MCNFDRAFCSFFREQVTSGSQNHCHSLFCVIHVRLNNLNFVLIPRNHFLEDKIHGNPFSPIYCILTIQRILYNHYLMSQFFFFSECVGLEPYFFSSFTVHFVQSIEKKRLGSEPRTGLCCWWAETLEKQVGEWFPIEIHTADTLQPALEAICPFRRVDGTTQNGFVGTFFFSFSFYIWVLILNNTWHL